MRKGSAVVLVSLLVAGSTACGVGLFREYEYEEEMYLSLDGTATMYLNSSIAALNALRGTSFDARPNAFDRQSVTAYFSSPVTHVTRVTTSRRRGRLFVHVRLDADDISRLSAAAPFAWSAYRFSKNGNLFEYQQTVGSAAAKDVGSVGWTGRELAAFRLHLPSKIRYHNAGNGNLRRGNILVWEQSLANRLRGESLVLEARMDPESILYRTLWLFAATLLAVAVLFVAVVWWVFRRGAVAQSAQVSS